MSFRCILCALQCCALFCAYDISAEQIKKVEFVGCQRVSKETASMYFPLHVGDFVEETDVNDAVKSLYSTGFYEKISTKIHKGVLTVDVVEYPVVERIAFEGNSSISDQDIISNAKIIPNSVLSPGKIREIQQGILEVYRQMGFYGASVIVKTVKQPNNKVILVFEVKEGKKAKIREIRFIGNKHFSSRTLRDVISSKVTRLLRFFVNDDIYTPSRLQLDKHLLEKYYTERGFVKARVVSAVAALNQNKSGFVITFTIDEGEQYKVNNVVVKSTVQGFDCEKVQKKLYSKKGKVYNSLLVAADTNIVARESLNDGSATKVVPITKCDDDKKSVDITIHAMEIEKIYISKIVILGNTRTREHVIRRELVLHEGDVYTENLANLSESRLYDLGFFKSVKVSAAPDPNSVGRCVVYIEVEEQPTGQAAFSMQYTYLSGLGTNVAYSEANFLGTGKSFAISISSQRTYKDKREVSDSQEKITMSDGQQMPKAKIVRKKKFEILHNVTTSVGSKHIFNTNIDGVVSLFSRNASSFSAVDMRELGGSFGISYKLNDNFYQEIEYMLTQRRYGGIYEYESPIFKQMYIKKNAQGKWPFKYDDIKYKNCVSSSITHTIGYDVSFLTGLRGNFNASLQTTFAGIGGGVRHLANELTLSYSWKIFGNTSASIIARGGIMTKIGNKPISIVDSFILGDSGFRGFAVGGIGPQAVYGRVKYVENKKKEIVAVPTSVADQYIGGKKYWTLTTQLSLPLGFPEEFAVRFLTLLTAGCVWDPPYTGDDVIKKVKNDIVRCDDEIVDNEHHLYTHKIINSKKIRMSLSFGIHLVTPMGPMSIYYSVPLVKHKSDTLQRIGFEYSTVF